MPTNPSPDVPQLEADGHSIERALGLDDSMLRMAQQLADAIQPAAELERVLAHQSVLVDIDIVRRNLALDLAPGALQDMRQLAEPFEAIRRQAEATARMIDSVSYNNFGSEDPIIRAARESAITLQASFVLPHNGEIARLLANSEKSIFAEFAREQQTANRHLQEVLESIRTPFLWSEAVSRSVSSVTELYDIGKMLEQANCFSARPTDALRTAIGDWQEPIDWARWDLTKPAQRQELYAERGFDTRLVDFPEPAFLQILNETGISSESGLELVLPSPLDGDGMDERIDANQMPRIYSWLSGLERQLREFIDRIMTARYGTKWIKQRAPRDIGENCKRRREEAAQAGMAPQSLIEYFDFGDYVKVVTRSDNWRDVFKDVFGRSENFSESMQRLYPVRNSIMHSRLLTREDLLILLVEVRRLVKAISRHKT